MSTIVSGPSITDNNNNPLSPDSSSMPTTSGSSAGGSGSSDMKPSIKAGIIGGILGGVAFMSIIAVLFFCLGRGRRSRRDSVSIQPPNSKPYDTDLNEAAPPTTASISVMDVSSPPPPLHLKEMREAQGARVASSEGSGSRILPTEEASNTPIANRVSYHPSEWQSPTSQSQPWLMTNPPAYTVRPISGHVHAGGDTLSDFDRP
ncbi:hypothetical protein FS842_001543 [Serendipita sp. 407]|nr:hypothetical protein FRC15_010397 [Serendipita sp. 397]KAG8864726.1 hypothetical protein FRC20_010097 [Serendipita sp. 405]KAG9044226.1 hypothetical protein FS842_001543 [Serendipita sp. 407]